MKKEATGKKKTWLWLAIGVVALLAIAGVVAAFLLGGYRNAGNNTNGRAELYWNVDQAIYLDGNTGMSLREPGEDGQYRMRFAYEGKVEEYVVADKRLVNFIDTMECIHLVLDDAGNVVDARDPRDVAVEVGKKVYVRYVRNDTIYVNTSIAMNGMTLMLDVTELTRVYDVSPDAEILGAEITAEDLKPMDCVTVYGNEQEQNTHVFRLERPEKSPVYWRVKGMYDSATAGTKRVPDATGAYSIEFFCDGELVTLKCRDKAIVDHIDYKSDYKAHFGFVLDEEGYIVKRIDSEIGVQGRRIAEGYDVTNIDDVEIEVTSQIWSNAGDMEGFKLEDDTVIYDVSKAAYAEGRQGKQVESLQMGDRVVVWLDTENDAILVYITERLVDSPMYYNVNRKYSSSKGESTRTPDADGWYYVDLAVNGTVKTFKTQDKSKIDYLDSFSPKGLGLKVKGDNEIEYVYHANCIYGQKYFCDGRYVTNITGSILELWSRTQDKTYNCILDPEYKVYDLSGVGEMGSETTLRKGDNVLAYQKPTGELICFYVLRRTEKDAGMYWNLSRKYDSTIKQTTREPDENGWYIYSMAHNGKTVTLKTQSRALATKVDSFSPGAVGLVVSGDVILSAYDPKNVYGGNQLTSGTYVSSISAGAAQTYSLSKYTYTDFTIAEDCKIYNISGAYQKEKGEPTTLRMGDMITVYANIKNEAAVIFVRSREVDNMYWKQDRFYDSTNEVTTRVPDAEGYYVYNLAVNGTVKTYKTKDKEVANKLDASESGFTLMPSGDEIIRYVSASYTRDVKTDGAINWDVVAVNGRTVTVKYNRPGSADTGTTKTITLAAGAKIMDVSPTAESFGAYTTLQPGDRIRGYVDNNDNHLYVWIKFRATREQGVESYCAHCGETVFWNPYMGGGITKADGHYYLVEDSIATGQTTVGSDDLDYEIVIDLNGKTLTRSNGRALLVYKGDKLTVMDTVGGGEIRSTGTVGSNGGVALINGNAEFTLMSGTLRHIPGETAPAYGGVIAITGSGSVFNMEGGKLADGRPILNDSVSRTIGGNIYCYQATVNLSGGVIENGAAIRGGNLYFATDGKLNMTGGEIRGGTSETEGGNIFLSTRAVGNFTGGTIAGGKSATYGGNIYTIEGTTNFNGTKITAGEAKYGGNVAMSSADVTVSGGSLENGNAKLYGGNLYVRGNKLTISGGKISGGTAGDYAGNIYLTSTSTCDLTLSGGEILGDVRINGAGSVTVTGAPKIGVGSEGGLDLRNGVVLTLGQLTTGADIAISTSGAFTAYREDAESYVNYFRTATQGGMIYEQEGILYASEGAIRFADCDHCGETVIWKEWKNTATPASGHYYLTGDVDMERVRVNAGTSDNPDVDIILDLCGYKWQTGGNRAFWVYGYLAIMDSVGGGEITASGSDMGSGGVIRVAGTLELYGGTIRRITDTQLVGKGGVLQVTSGGKFIMKGGKLTGGTCVSYTDSSNVAVEAQGGSIYAEKATVRIQGGTIEGGTSVVGGNLYLKDSYFEMTGGQILGGISEGNGGNVFSSGSTETVITGGTITGGTAGNTGGDFYVYNTQAVVSVSNATLGDVNARNVKTMILSGKVVMESLTLGEGVKMNLGQLTEGTSIGITATGVFTEPTENAQAYLDAEYFVSIPAEQTLYIAEGALAAEYIPLGAVKKECPHCGETVLWQAWENTANPGSGHYFLADTVDMGRTRVNIGTSASPEADVVLDLNGKTWTTGTNRAFWVYGDLYVMDTVGGGEITAIGSDMGSGGVIRVDGSLVLHSGTIRRVAGDSLVGKGGVLYLSSGSEFTMLDGKLTGGICVKYTDSSNKTVEAQGGSIYAEGATVRIKGGTIENGSAASGGNLYLKSTDFAMEGGTVTGGTASGSGGNFFLTDSTCVITGGTVTGGTATSNGGNFFMETSTFRLEGGTIEMGVAGNRGGNLLVDKECDVTISGGLITGGQAAKQGGNLRINYASTNLTVSGGTIMGDMTVYSVGSFILSGSPKILMGNSAGLILGEGIDPSAGNANLKLTLRDLNPDAEIYISAVGEITDAPAAEYISCFKGALRTEISVNAEGVPVATQGSTGYCPHCWQTGTPATWTDAAQIPMASSGSYTKLSENGHYYLTGNITRTGKTSRLNIGGTSDTTVDVVIDLCGFTWKTTDNRVAQVFAQLTVMDLLFQPLQRLHDRRLHGYGRALFLCDHRQPQQRKPDPLQRHPEGRSRCGCGNHQLQQGPVPYVRRLRCRPGGHHHRYGAFGRNRHPGKACRFYRRRIIDTRKVRAVYVPPGPFSVCGKSLQISKKYDMLKSKNCEMRRIL